MQTERKTDVIANAPLLLFVVDDFPTLPHIRLLKGGDDLEAVIREELGTSDGVEEKPNAFLASLGVTRVISTPIREVHVHTHPDAESNLKRVIARLEKEMQAAAFLKEIGLAVEVGEDEGCGHCVSCRARAAAKEKEIHGELRPDRWN